MANTTSKVALVTGGSRGLGKDMSLQLAKKGFDIILTYNSGVNEASKVVDEIVSMGKKAKSIPLDVTNSKSFDAFVQSVKSSLHNDFGTENLFAIVNNAGTSAYTSIAETSEDESTLNEVIAVAINLHAPCAAKLLVITKFPPAISFTALNERVFCPFEMEKFITAPGRMICCN